MLILGLYRDDEVDGTPADAVAGRHRAGELDHRPHHPHGPADADVAAMLDN